MTLASFFLLTALAASGGDPPATRDLNQPVAAECGSCHALPPATGAHSLHAGRRRAHCADCHGEGYRQGVDAKLHQNGSADLGKRSGWDPKSRSCANACHGTKGWASGHGDEGGHEDDDGDER
jgi:hypothetical protein